MIRPTEIVSLTDFKRNTAAHLKRLKKGGVQVLTVNGRAHVIVCSPKTYERWAEVMDRADAVAGIREGLADIRRGGGMPFDSAMSQARERLRRKARRSA